MSGLWLLVGLALAQATPAAGAEDTATEADPGAVKGGAAPPVNVQLFAPSLDAEDTLWTTDAVRADSGTTTARLVLHYADQPLVYLNGAGEPEPVVEGVWQASLLAGHTRGPLRVGLDVPLVLRATGASTGAESGLGDLAADLKLTALSSHQVPVGLAVTARLGLPTATVQAPLGSDGITGEAALVLDTAPVDRVHGAVNAGVRWQPEVDLENLTYGPQAFWRAGVGVAITDAIGVSAELSQSLSWTETAEASRPLEALVGGRYSLGSTPLVVVGGAGLGLNQGIGTPRFRLVVGLSWMRLPPDRDTDLDGLLDSEDSCPRQPEDLDGVADGDGCPEPTRITVRVVGPDGQDLDQGGWKAGRASGKPGEVFEAMDGQLRISGWAPGMISDEVAVEVSGEAMAVSIPLAHIPGVLSVIGRSEEGELLEGVVWRALDTEHQGIPAGEEVELLPGAYDLVVVAPGHSPYTTRLTVTADTDDLLEVLLRPSKAEDAVDIIAITEAVHFQTAKAIILPESYALLDDVAAVLQATPEIRLVQVEGHTDDEGSPQGNQVLSEDRAAAIVAYLVHKGIAPERLSSVGYGQSRPVADNTTEQGRAQNRRVVFVVAERSTGGIGIGG